MCHAAEDADTDRGERISTIRNIHGKEAGYGTCETENSGEGTTAEDGKEEYPERDIERTSPDGKK